MKKWKRNMMACMAAAVLALGMSTMALAAEPAANTITVNGQGILKVAPDVATIHVTVEKTAKTAAQAQKDVNEELTDVIAAMKALGVTDEDIVTSHISVYPSYRYDEKTDKQVLENYQAYTSVNVTTNDVDNAGKYVDAALNAGATGTNGVTFSLEKPETYYNQALTEAVKAAQSSATAIAQAYGKPLGQVVSVVENSRNTSTSYKEMNYGAEEAMVMDAMATGSANRNTNISYEDIEVSANITAVYGF
ncbi:SIMPL domain-containing protein [Anaerotignum lactatifermentans]|uniref:SIMPL domain-containing protein n=1 Tax=Anaerotignum lactatifermentans TaxID=160404 RepID=UPI00174E210D|nr:SIMPL domain-containing protein [Anaerotignum lactatifermentans]HJE92989.1 SIMPL domain-containing protein [Anaerotignum lactatifermentans]